MIKTRTETVDDREAVRRVNEQAFEQPAEANLVEALREAAPHVSFVAEDDEGHVVGHVFFTPVTFESGEAVAAMALGPMAVAPEWQRRGVGSRLVREGLEECRRAGAAAVVVLGHADYYPRFGFARASAWGLRCKWPVGDEHFMALELVPGALDEVSGLVEYRPEFDDV